MASQIKQGSCNVEHPCTVIFTLPRTVLGGQDKCAVLRMIAVVRAGVVLLHMNARVRADAPNRTPRGSSEVHHQIGSHVPQTAEVCISL